MTVSEMTAMMDLRPVWSGWENREIKGVHSSDLLSDVMANAVDGALLITIQAHKNTIAVATLKDLSAVLICSDRPIPEDMAEAAKDEGIPVFVTAMNQYEACWRVHGILGS